MKLDQGFYFFNKIDYTSSAENVLMRTHIQNGNCKWCLTSKAYKLYPSWSISLRKIFQRS